MRVFLAGLNGGRARAFNEWLKNLLGGEHSETVFGRGHGRQTVGIRPLAGKPSLNDRGGDLIAHGIRRYLRGDKNGRLALLAAIEQEAQKMKLYLAGQAPWKEDGLYNAAIQERCPYILESFYYATDWTEKMIPQFGAFLLDSGAFTLFSDAKRGRGVVWEEYVDKYADFILRNKVQNFFELDIDKLVGYERVLTLRRRLEKKVGAQSIPVWHKSRGKDNFLRMCRDYKYVAIGGIVSKEITPDEYKYFSWFIQQAHKAGAKIHGLGFTALTQLHKYHFDSVDSTAWVSGNRFGSVYYFNGRTMEKLDKGKNQRMKNGKLIAINNFTEWCKFQRYAETHL